jgi:hypothetical protein
MVVEVLPPQQWARRHFGEVQLGDKRRTERAVSYAAAAAAAPASSIPLQCKGDWGRTKGAYRFFDMPQVSLDQLQEPHRRQTLEAAGGCAVTLWVSDTTTLSFDHPRTAGLGPTSGGGSGHGMLLHTTMAVDVSGGVDEPAAVLGLGHQQVWARGTGEAADHKKPESVKWSCGVDAIGKPPANAGQARWVHVGDAESDCWEAIEACRECGAGFAIRACQNRQVIEGHDPSGEAALLFDLLRRQPAIANKELWVRGREDRAARWAHLTISATAVTLLAPKNWPDKEHRRGRPRPEPIQCWAVRVYETDAPAGQEPIEWVILTDRRVDTAAAALEVVYWYSCRWLIEEYHKCLKTGCRIESRQLEEARRLKSLLGILGVVAVRLLQLKHQAKVNPDAPATSVVPENYVNTLAAYLKETPSKLTAHRFWRETAKLGGFLGRKSDGDPGWLTLWLGWQHLETLTAGVELAQRLRRSG